MIKRAGFVVPLHFLPSMAVTIVPDDRVLASWMRADVLYVTYILSPQTSYTLPHSFSSPVGLLDRKGLRKNFQEALGSYGTPT